MDDTLVMIIEWIVVSLQAVLLSTIFGDYWGAEILNLIYLQARFVMPKLVSKPMQMTFQ